LSRKGHVGSNPTLSANLRSPSASYGWQAKRVPGPAKVARRSGTAAKAGPPSMIPLSFGW